jgi:putative DNA-invertase from lambdoid prophage Rac
VLNLVEGLNNLSSWGVRFLATSQAIDTDQASPTSKLLLWILAAVAEFEREMIRERAKAGMSAARHRGKNFGRPKAVFDRLRALEMQAAGLSVREMPKKRVHPG